MTTNELTNRVNELEQQLSELQRQDVPEWHFEVFSDLTNWFNASKSDADDGAIDLSADFGIPAKTRAVLLRCDVHDNTITAVKFGDSSGGSDFLMYTGYGASHDQWVILQGTVPCDSNGDIWLTIDAGVTITMSLFVVAYYI